MPARSSGTSVMMRSRPQASPRPPCGWPAHGSGLLWLLWLLGLVPVVPLEPALFVLDQAKQGGLGELHPRDIGQRDLAGLAGRLDHQSSPAKKPVSQPLAVR